MDCKTIISLAASNRHHAILGTIRVEYTPDGRIASVSATDTETTIVLSRAGSSGKVAMALFPPDKRFAPDTARVETAKDGPRLMLGGSRLLPVDDTKEEYPPLPGRLTRTGTIDTDDWRRAVSRVGYAVPRDDNRYGLNGMHLERLPDQDDGAPGGWRLAATDGSRLAFTGCNVDGDIPKAKDTLLPLPPIKAMLATMRAGPVSVAVNATGRTLQFEGDAGEGWTATCWIRLPEGEFPPYRSVIPSGYLHTLTVNRAAFLAAVRQVLPVANDRACTVNARYSGGFLYLSARNPEASAHVRVACRIENHDGPPPEKGADPVVAADPSAPYGFNGTFLRDTLDSLEGDTATWSWGMELSPSSLVDGTPGNEAIIMPIRIEGCAPEVDPSVPTIEPPVKATRKPSRKPAPVSCETPAVPVPDSAIVAERDALAAQVADLARRLNVALKDAADLRILLDEARAAVPVAPLAIVSPEEEDTTDPPTVEAAPVVRLPAVTVQRASTPEEAAASYKAARDALKSGNPATMARALARLPDWPSKKASELRASLSAAMKAAA